MEMKRFVYFVLVLVAALVSGSCKNNDLTGGQQPLVSGMSPSQAFPGQQNVEGVITGNHFNGIVAVNLGDGITILSSNLIDSTQISVRFSVNANASPGPRTISVTTPAGSGTNTTLFKVSNNKAPVAKFAVNPNRAGIRDAFLFDASDSSDPDGKVTEYMWDFGDNQSARGRVVEHKYESANVFNVQLTVKDNKEGTSVATHSIEVLNTRSPVPHFNVIPPRGNVETTFKFDGGPSTDDKRISKYVWKFGDGRREEGKIVRHKYRRAERFQVELTVEDSDGLKSSLIKNVEIIGKPPIARFDVFPGSGNPATIFRFDSSDSDDPDGHIVSREWSFGDGKSSNGQLASHTYGKTGSFKATLTVTDNSGMKDS